MLTDERLAEIKERTSKATPGNWARYSGPDSWQDSPTIGSDSNTEPIATFSDYCMPLQANVEFVIHAHQDIPELLSHIKALTEIIHKEGAEIVRLSKVNKAQAELLDVAAKHEAHLTRRILKLERAQMDVLLNPKEMINE